MTEVLDHAPDTWTPSERLVVLAIAEQANDGTRRGSPDVRLIAHRAGIDVESLSKTLRRLAAKGTELRVPTGMDKAGRVVFAFRSHRTDFAIPRFCPEDEHRTNVCMKRPDAGPAKLRHRERTRAPETPDGGPAKEPQRTDLSPANDGVTPDGGPAKQAEWPDGGPQWPDGGPALPLSTLKEQSPQRTTPQALPPSASAASWSETDQQTAPSVTATNAARSTHASALFSKPAVRLPEATEVVLDALRGAGYPETTVDDAKAVRRAVAARYGTKATVGYLKAIAGRDGFAGFYADVRAERAQRVEDAIRRLQSTEPACEHGHPAGRSPHPSHGSELCPLCRKGVPGPTDVGPATSAEVAAALDAYRAVYAGVLRISDLIVLTQQASALHLAGATAAELTTLATRAAQAGEALFTAAIRRDS